MPHAAQRTFPRSSWECSCAGCSVALMQDIAAGSWGFPPLRFWRTCRSDHGRRRGVFQHLSPAALFSLQGKVALITGAAGGIASGLARGFAAAGSKLVLADSNGAVEKRADEFQRAGADAIALKFDVTDAQAVDNA